MLLPLLFSGVGAFGQSAMGINFLSTWDNPSAPNNSGVFYNEIWGYADSNGREYAIMGGIDGTYFIDVTSPTSPSLLFFEAGAGTNCVWRDYKTYNNYLYAISDGDANSTLQIFDLGDLPSKITKVYDSDAIFSEAHNIFIDQNTGRAYVGGAAEAINGFMILDVGTNPASPSHLVTFFPGYTHDLYSHNDTVYAFLGNWGLQAYDLTNLASPGFLISMSSYPSQGYCHSGWANADNSLMVFADETHNTELKVMDVSDMNNPTFTSTFKSNLLAPAATNSLPHNPVIKDDLVYVAYYQDGLQVYDISNPATPVNVAYYDTHPQNTDYTGWSGAWGVYPFLPSGNLIVSDTRNGLFVLTMNTTFPVEFSSFEVKNYPDQVRLDWTTETEKNNEYFAVERSDDGVNFVELERQPGALNSNEPLSYSGYDMNPLDGYNHYRIRQVDVDGNDSYSETKTVFRGEPFRLLSMYPSPLAQGKDLKVKFTLEEPQNIRVRITNMLGYTLYENSRECNSGLNDLAVPTDKLPAGIYQASIFSEGQSFSQKIVITQP